MDVSGGSGQPRSGNDKPAEHPAGPTAPTTGPTDPAGPQPRPAADHRGTEADAKGRALDRPTAPRPAQPAADTTDPDDGSDAPAPAGDTTGTGAGSANAERTHAGPADTGETGTSASDAGATDGHPEATDRSDAGTEGHPGGPTRPENAPAPGTGTGHARDTRPEHRSLAHSGIAKGEPPQPRPKEPGGGILMGRPFGVPVYVAPSWFLVAALITWVFGGQLDRVLPELGAARYLVSLFFAVAFYASVLVHELAHTVAAIRFKLPVRRIQLQFFGGVSEIEKEAETPGREFVLAFVGPLLSLVLAGLFYLAMKPVEPGTVPGVLLAGLMISNLIVAIFNLLPGLPLDGGRMLRAVVWAITGKPMSGTVAAAWVGRALAVAVLIGLPLLNQSGALGGSSEDTGGMDTVTDALLAAILAAIIWTGAGNSLRMARLREHLPELRARTLTRRAVPVETDTPLSEALRRANAAGARALVVVDAHGNPLSLVRESAIVGVPEHRRPWVAVSGLAQELTDGMRVSAELAGEELLDVLRATPATEYLVVEESGEIYGVLSAADVERAFVKAMARPS
ncbi:site-2 protease family protein [Streptomyces sp. NPDC001852]|uniref:site-2 protease family protein n=1 Tax=Streptomyces sp. NPDC001852 TaxID=3364619 RepID=UPI0036928EF2